MNIYYEHWLDKRKYFFNIFWRAFLYVIHGKISDRCSTDKVPYFYRKTE